jgi:hypothetical protein
VRTQLLHPGCLECSLLSPSRRTDAQCCVPSICSPHFAVVYLVDLLVALSASTSIVGVNLFFQCVPYTSVVLIFSHYRMLSLDVSARLLPPLKAVRLPNVGRNFLSFATDIPLFLLSSSPLLEARRLSPVHMSYFLYSI